MDNLVFTVLLNKYSKLVYFHFWACMYLSFYYVNVKETQNKIKHFLLNIYAIKSVCFRKRITAQCCHENHFVYVHYIL